MPISIKAIQIGGNKTATIDYSFDDIAACLMFAARDANYGVYMADTWSRLAKIHEYAGLSISVTDKVITLKNDSSSAINVVAFIAHPFTSVT